MGGDALNDETMNNSEWEEYIPMRPNRPRDSLPVLSPSKNGVGRINKAGWVALGSPDTIVLMWDRISRSIGIRAGRGERFAFRLSQRSVMQFSLVSFVRRHDIALNESRRMRGGLAGDMLIFPLWVSA